MGGSRPEPCSRVITAALLEESSIELTPLWEAACRDPDSDSAMRVLSDALLERGDPLGQFIALQLGPQARGRAAGLGRLEEERLLAKHRDAWVVPGMDPKSVVFERGLPRSCTVDRAPRTGDPRWQAVQALSCRGAAAAVLFERPDVVGLRVLRGAKDAVLTCIARSPGLPKLEQLTASVEGVSPLLQQGLWQRVPLLGELEVEGPELTADELTRLVVAGARRLRRVRCYGSGVHLRVAVALSRAQPQLALELTLDQHTSVKTWFALRGGQLTIASEHEARWSEDREVFCAKLRSHLGLVTVPVTIRGATRVEGTEPRDAWDG